MKDWDDKRIKKKTEEESKNIEESHSTNHTITDNLLNEESFNIESTLESLNNKCESRDLYSQIEKISKEDSNNNILLGNSLNSND